jgi:glycosyltransferase involved in cell wall biosynthesis
MPPPTEPLVIAFPFAGDSIGGSHVSVLGLLNQLDRSRFHPLIVTEVPGGRIAKMFADFDMVADPAGLAPVAPGQRFGPLKFLRTLAGLPARVRFLKEHKIALVHSNDGRTHANWALAAKLAGVPFLWHHRADPRALGMRLAAPLLATRVLTVSGFAKPRQGWWSAAAKSHVVHSPFDTSLAVDRGEARRRLLAEVGATPDTLLVGFFGSLVRRKRPILFVDAVLELQKLVDRPVLGLIFGDGSKDALVSGALEDKLRSPDAASHVRLLGFRNNGAFWIAGCDQLMVPAIGEPFGRTLIEAMLVGTPVVASASGGNIEALENGRGILVPPDDARALAEAAARLANSPEETMSMILFAQADARRRFGVAKHVADVSAAYEELVGTTARRTLVLA